MQPSVGGTKVMAGLVASAQLHPLHISVHRQIEGELSVLPRRRGRWLQGCLHCLLANGYYLVVHLGGVQIYWERMKNEAYCVRKFHCIESHTAQEILNMFALEIYQLLYVS